MGAERESQLTRIQRLEALLELIRAVAAGISSGAQPAILLWGNNNVAATVTTRFLEPGYESSQAPTLVVQFRVPFGGVLRNMRVHCRTGAGNGNAIVYTVRVNSIVTTLIVSMASTATDGSNLVNTATVAAGDLVDVQVTKALGIGASPSDIVCSLQLGFI